MLLCHYPAYYLTVIKILECFFVDSTDAARGGAELLHQLQSCKKEQLNPSNSCSKPYRRLYASLHQKKYKRNSLA
jgi:hypothetical protein